MTRMRRRLLEDFVIPALDSAKYGHKLCWVDKAQGIFRLYWSHKNAAKWTVGDTIVFQDWDRLKGHFKPEGSTYFMCAKQRFRAALYKLSTHVKPLKCSEKFHRDYQLIFDGIKKPSVNMMRSKTKVPKRMNQSSIPTSVIRKNTSYIAKPAFEAQTPRSLSPKYPVVEKAQVMEQYSCSMKVIKQLKMTRQYESESLEVIPHQSPPREAHETSVLRENSSTPRTPHIAPQVVPVYYSHRQFNSHHHHLQVCPDIFISKNYTGPENIPQIRDDTQSSVYTTDDDDDDDLSSGILNLSVRSEASSNAPSR